MNINLISRVTIILLVLLGCFTSCSYDDFSSEGLDRYDLAAIAASKEYAEYHLAVENQGKFFLDAGVDMELVKKIAISVGQGNPNFKEEFEKEISSIKGGIEYLATGKRVREAMTAYMERFNISDLSKEEVKEINRLYRSVHSSSNITPE